MMNPEIATRLSPMFILPQTAEYALRATLHIASRHPESVRVSELSAAVNAPANYLSKTLNQLARAGVLASTRGPAGGFRLRREPSRVSLAQVVAVFVGGAPRRCLLGTGQCGTNPQCAVHERWKPLAGELDDFFRRTTLGDVVAGRPTTVASP